MRTWKKGASVTSNNIEMMLYAWMFDKWQSYTADDPFGDGTISPAIKFPK